MKRTLRLLAVCAVVLAAGFGAASTVAGNGPPPAPPGQGECEHGNSGQPCKPDPQPTNGKDCDEHGNSGGVNEDHCLGTTSTPGTTSTTTPGTSTPGTTSTPDTTSTPQTTSTTETRPTTSSTSTSGTTPVGTSTPPPTATTPTGTGTTPASETTPESGKTETNAKTPKEKRDQKDSPAGGVLPYTGLPLWAWAILGAVAAVTGILLRRLDRYDRFNH